ncbi:MAG: DUF4197 domain-containing protein [Burkholderiales bacterium]|nr:DUF4197 domain-containing protein [Flavobacterium sp.]
MKKILLLLPILYFFSGCAELQQVVSQYPQIGTAIGNPDIAAGLKEALDNGITKQVSKLTATDGFFKNEAVKILLPQELQKVDKTLRSLGMSSLADEGLKVLNRAAENAVKEATPIFVGAVKNMSFNDAKTILLGGDNSATLYLQNSTTSALYGKFSPVVQSSLSKVGADKVWTSIISKYNAIPLVNKVNPDLKDYVTQQALKGVFKMVAVEEKDIRRNLSARTSDLLRRVFALQD